jgi:hypothetical protein
MVRTFKTFSSAKNRYVSAINSLNELCFWTLSIVWCLKNKQNEELKIYTKYHNARPQKSHLLQGFMCVCAHVSCSVVSNWPLCEFCGRVYCDILYIFLILQFFETLDDG